MGKRMTSWTKAGIVVGTVGWIAVLVSGWTDFFGDPARLAAFGICLILVGVSLRFAGIEETLYEDKDGDR